MQATRASLHRRGIRLNSLSWTVLSGILGLSIGACSSHSTDRTPSSTGGAGGSAAGAGAGGAAGQAGTAGTTNTSTAGGGGAGLAGSAGAAGAAGVAGSPVTVTELPPYDSGNASLNAVAANQICERLSTIQCAGEEHCCDKPGRTKAQCYATMLNGCTTKLYLDQIAAQPNANFSAQAAEAAFTKFDTLASNCGVNVATWGTSVAGLRGILLGTLAAGANCTPPAAHLTDPVYDGASLASCKDLTTHACLPGNLGLNWTCKPRSNVNGACFTDVNCNDNLYCDNPKLDPLTSHSCLARKAVGAPCTAPNECLSLACKHKLCVTADQQAAYCLAN